MRDHEVWLHEQPMVGQPLSSPQTSVDGRPFEHGPSPGGAQPVSVGVHCPGIRENVLFCESRIGTCKGGGRDLFVQGRGCRQEPKIVTADEIVPHETNPHTRTHTGPPHVRRIDAKVESAAIGRAGKGGLGRCRGSDRTQDEDEESQEESPNTGPRNVRNVRVHPWRSSPIFRIKRICTAATPCSHTV